MTPLGWHDDPRLIVVDWRGKRPIGHQRTGLTSKDCHCPRRPWATLRRKESRHPATNLGEQGRVRFVTSSEERNGKRIGGRSILRAETRKRNGQRFPFHDGCFLSKSGLLNNGDGDLSRRADRAPGRSRAGEGLTWR